jgi:hypothetical protein
VAYVLPKTVTVVDTPAEIRRVVGTLYAGEQVRVLSRGTNWTHVRMPNRHTGWVENKNLLDAATYGKGQELQKQLNDVVPQASGKCTLLANLRDRPSRDAQLIGVLDQNQAVQIYERKLVARPVEPGQEPPVRPIRDAWYLVRSETEAGWTLGRLITVVPPRDLAPFAAGQNMVSWVVLTRIPDGDRMVPEYLAADRIGKEEADFNHIRVFTWWKRRQHYVTAYIESGLAGYFPLQVFQEGTTPYFRLRLVDDEGHKYQKVYAMFDTIVRSQGTVEGWDSPAMPEDVTPPPKAEKSGRKRLVRQKR